MEKETKEDKEELKRLSELTDDELEVSRLFYETELMKIESECKRRGLDWCKINHEKE